MPRPLQEPFSPRQLAAIRRSRRHPRLHQFDYLHLRYVLEGLADALAGVPPPVEDVLDVWCGSRPYDDLFPEGARVTGLDVAANPYGVADVTSDELVPLPSASFDLVTCIEAFQYVPDPAHAIREFRRVLRPGGTLVVSLPFAGEYDRGITERRYSAAQLAELFEEWDDVGVRENGGRIVVWAVLGASLLRDLETRVKRRYRFGGLVVALAVRGVVAALNAAALPLARLEDAHAHGDARLPMNLTLTARRPRRV